MYFEPSKKNYYRFPSSVSIQELDKKYYFPDKPYANGESMRMTSKEEPDNIYLDIYNNSK